MMTNTFNTEYSYRDFAVTLSTDDKFLPNSILIFKVPITKNENIVLEPYAKGYYITCLFPTLATRAEQVIDLDVVTDSQNKVGNLSILKSEYIFSDFYNHVNYHNVLYIKAQNMKLSIYDRIKLLLAKNKLVGCDVLDETQISISNIYYPSNELTTGYDLYLKQKVVNNYTNYVTDIINPKFYSVNDIDVCDDKIENYDIRENNFRDLDLDNEEYYE